ncbi:MAG: restriction endonuclease subunit S, partial [Bacteroidota bacterium]
SAQPKLNGSKLMGIEVPLPDGETLSSFHAAINNILSQKNDVFPSDSLFQVALNKAFSGELTA